MKRKGRNHEKAVRTRPKENGACVREIELHVSLGPPAADDVGERQWQSTTERRPMSRFLQLLQLPHQLDGDGTAIADSRSTF
ncbi:hypothetical protein AVEN_215080-1 [Araneus ventricosus]|uniref:Uncharacterized protein n=1 Tax=Araneus ventricosus TaxID=182803 RepID=A0A4Y2QA17_ARAVE|nr:hypothetical protein AVEN_155239-1 [Araneus ventricosus]GBN60409.1 hypothetical protein AVEN_175856-1 [Araneus ventricosus]GBN60413.1 hypothetical protein AVEN_215080-1 [Araneus ventricosus]